MPKVSILVPLYETKEQHLRDLINSVISQTYQDYELILLNDSPDCNYIDSLVSEYTDSRIKYLKNPVNLGISLSRNRLIEESRGKYLAILDHDDICLPTRIQKQVEYLDLHQEVGVCSSWTIEIPEGKIFKTPENDADIKLKLMSEYCLVHSASMIRKSLFIKYKIEYKKEYTPCEDYKLWSDLINVTKFHNLQEPLIKYRKHEGNTSNKFKTDMETKTYIIRSELIRSNPLNMLYNSKKTWIYLFSLIPFIKVRRFNHRTYYYLFGIIPILMEKMKQ